MLEAAMSGLDLHETKISYTSNSELQKLNIHVETVCELLFIFFPSIFVKNCTYCTSHSHGVSNLEIHSTSLFHVPMSYCISLKKHNSSMYKLRDLKTCMKKHCLPIWTHFPKKYCITKKHRHWLKQIKQKTVFRDVFLFPVYVLSHARRIFLFSLYLQPNIQD